MKHLQRQVVNALVLYANYKHYHGQTFGPFFPQGLKAAKEVARRICGSVAQDEERPPISVSVGVALYGRDGVSLDALLASADRVLYQTRERSSQKLPAAP